jgi:hypothetical protein
MPQPESLFKQRLVKCFIQAYPRDGWCSYLKPVKVGTPDLVFAHLTHGTAWIEAKAHGKPLSGAQTFQIGKMKAAGMRVRVIDVHMVQGGARVPWKRWSLSIDYLESRRANRICQGELMATDEFWEGLLS